MAWIGIDFCRFNYTQVWHAPHNCVSNWIPNEINLGEIWINTLVAQSYEAAAFKVHFDEVRAVGNKLRQQQFKSLSLPPQSQLSYESLWLTQKFCSSLALSASTMRHESCIVLYKLSERASDETAGRLHRGSSGRLYRINRLGIWCINRVVRTRILC